MHVWLPLASCMTMNGKGDWYTPLLVQTMPMSKQRKVLFPRFLEPLNLAVPFSGFWLLSRGAP